MDDQPAADDCGDGPPTDAFSFIGRVVGVLTKDIRGDDFCKVRIKDNNISVRTGMLSVLSVGKAP